MTLKKIGGYNLNPSYRGASFYREADGTVWVRENTHGNYAPATSTKEGCVPLFAPDLGESLEGFIAALRAACADPRERVIAAARAYVKEQAETWGTELAAAVNALEHAECDDDSEDSEEFEIYLKCDGLRSQDLPGTYRFRHLAEAVAERYARSWGVDDYAVRKVQR